MNEHIQSSNNDYFSYLAMHATAFYSQLSQISPRGWTWKPTPQASSIYRQIWESSEWKNFKSVTEKMKNVHKILTDVDRTDQDFYQLLQNTDLSTKQIVVAIATSKVLTALPDVGNLKRLIDIENRTYTSSIKKSSKSKVDKDCKYRQFGKVCAIEDENHPILKHLVYDVPQLPLTYLSHTKESKCASCNKTFSFFMNKCRCRMCDKLACGECLLWQTCRHIGYLYPVAICRCCSEKKATILIDTICLYIQQQIAWNQYEYLAEYLSLLKVYGFENNEFYESVGLHLLRNHQFKIALPFADYVHQSENEWLSLAEMMVHMNAYDEVATCFHIISRQFQRCTQYWVSLGDAYRKKQADTLDSHDPVVLALLIYKEAGLSWEEILQIAVNESNIIIRHFLVLYVTQTHRRIPSEWKIEGESWLSQQHKRSVGLCCLHLAQLSVSEWNRILQNLIYQSEYYCAAALLQTLSPEIIEYISFCADPVVCFFCEEANNSKLPMIDRLKQAIESPNIDNILAIAALVHLHGFDDIWNVLKEEFLSEPKQYDKVLICHKIQVELNQSISLDWIDQGIIENDSIAFDLKDSTRCDWLELGRSHLKAKNYDTALNCFFKSVKGSLNDRAADFERILSLIYDLPDSVSLWYAVSICKHAQGILSVACHCVQYINQILDSKCQSNNQFIISALHHMNKTEEPMPSPLFDMHSRLLNGLMVSTKEFIGGLHFLETQFNTQSLLLTCLRQQYDKYIFTRDYDKIKEIINVTIAELANCLKEVTSVDALKQFLKEYIVNRPLEKFPTCIKVKLYLIDATIAKLENRYVDFIEKLQEASTCCWSEEELLALVILTKDPLLHRIGTQLLLSEIRDLSSTDLSKIKYLIMPVICSPKLFQNENFLKPSPLVLLVHRYEKAILKEMKNDPFQCAMAYLDLCSAVSNRTCIASNWILASMYLYEGLSRMSSLSQYEPKFYAYRNLINELAVDAFLLARERLAPNMQIYIYRLVLSLLVHTNRLFKELIKPIAKCQSNMTVNFIVSSQHTIVVNQILNYMTNFTKLVPIIPLSPLLSYDVIFIELVGLEFFRRYLKDMAEDYNKYQQHFYNYYLLEGIWNGWIVNENFECIRQKSMKSLLATRRWKISDVEFLLNDPLIPRTLSGWLYSKRKPLVLSGRKSYAKVDGIKFNITTGKVTFLFVPARHPEHIALFDSDDVADVFKKGISNAIFSLDQPKYEFLSHPFQTMKYAPSGLTKTRYLTTLLHTDYLLKFITLGVEINSKWPFPIRKASEGFMQRLPKHLQDLLKPIEMRDKFFTRGNIHRFWIEAGDPVYEFTINKETNEIIYRIDDVPMYVKQHLLKYDYDGNLVDDDRFDSEPDRSSEAQFAKAFTDNYKEIGAYFPEFLRLQELAKLGLLLTIIQNHYDFLRKDTAEDVHVQYICNELCKARQDLEYPLNIQHNVDDEYWKILRENNLSSWAISHEQNNDIHRTIRSQFEKWDHELLENMTEFACKLCYSSETMKVEALIDRWLSWSSKTVPVLWSSTHDSAVQLVSFIRKATTDYTQRLISEIKKLNVLLEPSNPSLIGKSMIDSA
ncbi:unnamed protein product [Rotaria sp. Silwood1]|nr:unnamed protein product [Rotaria sp. Silwood1]